MFCKTILILCSTARRPGQDSNNDEESPREHESSKDPQDVDLPEPGEPGTIGNPDNYNG